MERHQGIPKKALAAKAALSKLIKDLDRDPGDYEPISPSQWPPLQALLPQTRQPTRALFVTKDSVLNRWMAEDLLPRDSVILCRYGLPSEGYLQEVRSHLSRARQAIFVGDLDPLDLHLYLVLRGQRHLAIHYGGINDACLELCERNLKKGSRLEMAMIRMGELEQRHFALLESWADLSTIIGERSHNLLRAGWKLELEGATNRAYFREDHLASMLSAIIKAARRRSPAL